MHINGIIVAVPPGAISKSYNQVGMGHFTQFDMDLKRDIYVFVDISNIEPETTSGKLSFEVSDGDGKWTPIWTYYFNPDNSTVRQLFPLKLTKRYLRIANPDFIDSVDAYDSVTLQVLFIY